MTALIWQMWDIKLHQSVYNYYISLSLSLSLSVVTLWSEYAIVIPRVNLRWQHAQRNTMTRTCAWRLRRRTGGIEPGAVQRRGTQPRFVSQYGECAIRGCRIMRASSALSRGLQWRPLIVSLAVICWRCLVTRARGGFWIGGARLSRDRDQPRRRRRRRRSA
jgi:hypothetical protein